MENCLSLKVIKMTESTNMMCTLMLGNKNDWDENEQNDWEKDE